LHQPRSIRSPVVVDIDRGLVDELLREENELEEARLEAMVSALRQPLRGREERGHVSLDDSSYRAMA